MSATYFFHEPGSVPGIPGLFCGVRVDVTDDGTHTVSPLPYHPHVEFAPAEEVMPPEDVRAEEVSKSKSRAKAVPIESEV